MSYKCNKYFTKLVDSDGNKNIYLHKLIKYSQHRDNIILSDQSGGDIITESNNIINKITKNDYTELYSYDKYKSTLPKKGVVTNVFDLDVLDDKTRTMGTYMEYFISARFIKDNSTRPINIYMAKREFKQYFTDIFMYNHFKEPHRTNLTNYVYYLLTYLVDLYIYHAKKNKIFGDKSVYLDNNINCLYKGGNTTRVLVNGFFDSVISSLPRNKDKMNEFKETYNSTTSIGDWDYNININYDTLLENGFTLNEVNSVYRHLVQVGGYAANVLKNKLDKLIYSKDINDSFTDFIIEFIDSEKVTNINNEIIDAYNNGLDTRQHVELKSLKINRITSMGYEIYPNEKKFIGEEYPNYTETSYMSLPKGKDLFYMTSPTFFIENKEKPEHYFPELYNFDLTSIGFLDGIYLIRKNLASSFTLYRVKINNRIYIQGEYMDGSVKDIKINSPVDILDISIADIVDTKKLFSSTFLEKGDNKTVIATINKKDDFIVSKNKMTIPSPEYMFSDISQILLIEQLFPWEDKKYEKRIKRILLLSLISLYSQNKTSDHILDNFNTMVKKIEDIRNTPLNGNLSDKINVIDDMFDVIISPFDAQLKKGINRVKDIKDLTYDNYVIEIKQQYKRDLKFTKHILSNILHCMLIINYVRYGIINNKHKKYVEYLLNIYRMYELDGYYNKKYFQANRLNLNMMFDMLRGHGHGINGTNLLDFNISGSLPKFNNVPTIETLENSVEKLDRYLYGVVEVFKYMIELVNTIKDGGLQKIDVKYNIDTLY